MEIIRENLWDIYEKGEYIAITTNGFVKKNGEAVMGAGCAKECAERFPWFPKMLGDCLNRQGNIVHRFGRILTFPVKHDWFDKADLELIRSSMVDLVLEADRIDLPIYLPKPGCGNGKLKWEDVEPIIKDVDIWDRIRIVDFP